MEFEINFDSQLSREIEQEFQKTLSEQIYYLSTTILSCKFNESCLVVEVSSESHWPTLHNQILEIVKKTSKSINRAAPKVSFVYEPELLQFNEDPHVSLFASRDLLAHSEGNYVLQGKVLRVMRRLDSIFREFALSLGAEEQEYPSTIPVDSAIECGYVANFPQHTGFISYVHKDLESITSLASAKIYNKELNLKTDLGGPGSILAPTVCYHCFQALKGKPLEREFAVFTAANKCHRNEDKMVVGLERLNTFNMREIIFFGSQDNVLDLKAKIFSFTTKILQDWGIKSRVVSANDPFFATTSSNKKVYQTVFDLKQEVQIYLPYRDKWLAVGSINNHLETLTKSFSISGAGKNFNSACVGYGLERFALGLFSQFGVEIEKWPKPLADVFA